MGKLWKYGFFLWCFTCKIDSISNIHCFQYMLVLLDRFLITWLYSLFYFFFSNEESKINLRVMVMMNQSARFIWKWMRDRSGGCIGNGKLPFTLVLFCIAVIVFAIATACCVRNFKKSFDSKNAHALLIGKFFQFVKRWLIIGMSHKIKIKRFTFGFVVIITK